jgi:hypothetical protein
MIKKEDYLKAKQIVQEYEKQLNISDVRKSSCQHNWIYKTFGWSRIPPFRYCSKCNKLK